MKYTIIIALALFIISCKNQEVADMFYPEPPYMSIEKHAEINIRISSYDQELISGTGPAFQSRAAQECFVRTARQVLQMQPLLKAGLTADVHLNSRLLEFHGAIKPQKAPLTDFLVHDFQCSLSILPHYNLAGIISGLEEQRTIAARGDRVALTLFSDSPPDLPAYFVIGRGTTEQGVNLIKVFGSGRIIQIVGEAFDPQNPQEKLIMAQGMIMETNHEVAKDDLIFLSLLDVTAISAYEETPPAPAEPTPTEDEVWVRPEIREPAPAPSEMK